MESPLRIIFQIYFYATKLSTVAGHHKIPICGLSRCRIVVEIYPNNASLQILVGRFQYRVPDYKKRRWSYSVTLQAGFLLFINTFSVIRLFTGSNDLIMTFVGKFDLYSGNHFHLF